MNKIANSKWIPWSGFVIALVMHLWQLGLPATIVSDETSFVRAGYDYTAQQSYFDPHPPLGKLQLGAVFLTIGYSPWTWRIINAVEGALIVPLLWWLTWRLTRRKLAALFAVIFVLLDGLVLVDSRLGMINIPFLLYGFTAFACILKALEVRRPARWLLAASLAIGMAVSVKWLAGLIILPAIAVWCWPKFFGQQRAKEQPWWTPWLVIGCFIILPTIVYAVVFAIHFTWLGVPSAFWSTNIKMINYHLSVPPTGDPQAQPWWGWPLMWQPFKYWSQAVGDKISFIWSLPNPWLWWTGFVVFIGSLIGGWRQPVTRLLNICLLATWLPFMFIQRVMYSYHAMAFDLFLIMLLAVVLDKCWVKYRRWVTAYLIVAAAVFIWFLPWYLNIPLGQTQHRWRQWLPNWKTTSALSLNRPTWLSASPTHRVAPDVHQARLK